MRAQACCFTTCKLCTVVCGFQLDQECFRSLRTFFLVSTVTAPNSTTVLRMINPNSKAFAKQIAVWCDHEGPWKVEKKEGCRACSCQGLEGGHGSNVPSWHQPSGAVCIRSFRCLPALSVRCVPCCLGKLAYDACS